MLSPSSSFLVHLNCWCNVPFSGQDFLDELVPSFLFPSVLLLLIFLLLFVFTLLCVHHAHPSFSSIFKLSALHPVFSLVHAHQLLQIQEYVYVKTPFLFSVFRVSFQCHLLSRFGSAHVSDYRSSSIIQFWLCILLGSLFLMRWKVPKYQTVVSFSAVVWTQLSLESLFRHLFRGSLFFNSLSIYLWSL